MTAPLLGLLGHRAVYVGLDEPTDWFLAVPQTRIDTEKLLDNTMRCKVCNEPEPDGVVFAIAVNGVCLCFDLRENAPDYPVFFYDHEEEIFTPYAPDFAAAVHRLASGE